MSQPIDTSYLNLDTKDEAFLDFHRDGAQHGAAAPVHALECRVILKLDGRRVLGTECVIGYLHRGVEKISKKRTYAMFNPYVDRMDYVAAVFNGLGYCETVEKLLNVGESPPRARSHPHHHLPSFAASPVTRFQFGTHALDIGAVTPLFYAFRDREEIL